MLVLAVLVGLAVPVNAEERVIWQIPLAGRARLGTPLAYDGKKAEFLTLDGRIWHLESKHLQQAKSLAVPFAPLNQFELQTMLGEEFGDQFQIAIAGQFLVLLPEGHSDKWSSRFEMLFTSMTQYFSARGIAVSEPMFPLVAIVFPNRDQWLEYADRTGAKVDPNWLGFYSVDTNRIAMYDFQHGTSSGSDDDWMVNAATIVHEAAHQTAYNIGVHSRWSPAPLWVVEGIGTMFEAPGIYDSDRFTKLDHRINRGQLETYRKSFGKELKSHTLATLISGDEAFRRSSEKGYAISWALTFMLAEQQPMDWAAYLKSTTEREPFAPYTAEERVADFQRAFGDIQLVQSRLEEFVKELK
jgi:hypothetical protein